MKNGLSPNNALVAVDIGTTKICVLIAHRITEAECEIVGIGKAPSLGLARGVIVDVRSAIQSIKTALQEAELMAGYKVEFADIGISGAHIRAHNSSGMVPIKHGEIRETDISRVVSTAKAVPIPEDEQILHVIPQTFTIDHKQVVRNPLGMHGVRLEAQVHIITGSVTSVQNLIRCCETAGIKVRDIVLEPLASADAVLSSDERELGVAMLDIGGGTSDFAVYQGGAIRHTRIFPIAGNLFTNDIALCLRTTKTDAERIKKEFGHALLTGKFENQPLNVQMIGGEEEKVVSLKQLTQIIEPRAEELFMMIKREIEKYSLNDFAPSGLVITGGGSLLNELDKQAEKVLNIPARIGRPKVPVTFKELIHNPVYATGYGLLVHAMKKEKEKQLTNMSGPLVSRVFWKMKSWISDFF